MNMLVNALQAYVRTVEYGQRCVNPEDWETHLDWRALAAQAQAAIAAYEAQAYMGAAWKVAPTDDPRWVNVLSTSSGLVGTMAPSEAARIVACVNACHGVADPAQAIEACRVLLYREDGAQAALDAAHAAGIAR